MRWLRLAALAVMFAAAAPAFAVQPDEILKDPVLEGRARELSRELRCMVCQNQSIDDSEATLARDLRVLVRERLQAGDSNNQVIDFLVSRYGEFVLLKPRFTWHNLLLWLTPVLVLVPGGLGLFVLVRRMRNQRSPAGSAAAALTPVEQAKLAALTEPRAGDRAKAIE